MTQHHQMTQFEISHHDRRKYRFTVGLQVEIGFGTAFPSLSSQQILVVLADQLSSTRFI